MSLYHALTAPDFETAVVSAVNMGNDTDTVGAVTGAVAGARFGAGSIPERWLDTLPEREEIRQLADQLTELSS